MRLGPVIWRRSAACGSGEPTSERLIEAARLHFTWPPWRAGRTSWSIWSPPRFPLFDAALRGHTTTVAALIAAGADVNACDRRGDTPLHTAAYAGNGMTALVLIDRGAAVLARNDRSETPIDLAIRYGHEAVSAMLVRLMLSGPPGGGFSIAAV